MGYKDSKFPKDSLFLITGAAGFIGSNLCEAILELGYKVRALDDLSTGKQQNIDIVEVDEHLSELSNALKEKGCIFIDKAWDEE